MTKRQILLLIEALVALLVMSYLNASVIGLKHPFTAVGLTLMLATWLGCYAFLLKARPLSDDARFGLAVVAPFMANIVGGLMIYLGGQQSFASLAGMLGTCVVLLSAFIYATSRVHQASRHK